MSPFAIQAENLTKTFRPNVVAVSGLDLAVKPGSVYGLMGRNGAGKTTALRLLTGLLTPDQGTARILGAELREAPAAARARVCYAAQSQQLPGWMTVDEICRYTASFYERWDWDLSRRLAKDWGLPRNRAIRTLSGGQQRRAALLLAFAPRPEVLILDEPAGGLDPIARRELVDELINVLTRGESCTVLVSTHLVADLERIADHIGILDRGRLILDARLDQIQTQMQRVQIIFPGENPPPGFALPPGWRQQVSGPVVCAVARDLDGEHLDMIQRWPGVRVQVFPMSLEEIFFAVHQRNQAAEVAEASDQKAVISNQ